MDVAASSTASLLLARTLVVARTDTGPGDETVDVLEDGHVRSDLCDERRGHTPADARDGHQTRVKVSVRLKLRLDSCVQDRQLRLHVVETPELHLEQEAVVLLDTALERELELSELGAQAPLRERSHLGGRHGALDQGVEHAPTRDAKHVTGDRSELDVRGLEDTQQPVTLARTAVDELGPIPR